MLLVAAVALIVAWQAVWPRLDEFTEGTITERFTEMDVTRRDDLGEEDLLTWAENPIFGVGPGRSSLSHDDRIIAHTEFTRVLAEHGSLGAAAAIALLLIGVQNVRRARPGIAQAVAAAMFVWSCLFMLNSAMRTVAPSLLFGLSCTCIRTTARLRRAPTARRAPRGAAAPVPSWRTP
jgi:O-antigen ligase